MNTATTNVPAAAVPPPIDAHVPPPRGAGLRKNALYLTGLVGAGLVLDGLAIASRRAQRSQPVTRDIQFSKGAGAFGT